MHAGLLEGGNGAGGGAERWWWGLVVTVTGLQPEIHKQHFCNALGRSLMARHPGQQQLMTEGTE
jgi:hypothetical protein